MLELSRQLLTGLPQNGATDPIEFYRRPLVGWLYRERINRGLRLLPQRQFHRALEVGYGAGAVQLTMRHDVDERHGIDLDADPQSVMALLEARSCPAKLVKGSVYELPYPDAHFDLVLCFSVFEHLKDYPRALQEIRRVLQPDGCFVLGMPSVNKAMEFGFRAIGFKGIEDHHITTPRSVANRFSESGLRIVRERHLDMPPYGPLGLRLYFNWLLQPS